MALLKLLKKDRIAGSLAVEGWYPAIIDTISSKVSKSGNTTNTFTNFVVTSGEMEGKEFTIALNDGMTSTSILGNLQFAPWAWIEDIHKAIFGGELPLDEKGDAEVDTDKYIGKTLDIHVLVVSQEGVPVNSVVGFAQTGAGSSTKLVF